MPIDIQGPERAPYTFMLRFEIAAEDEADFNEIYDSEHVPCISKVAGVLGILRMRDTHPSAAGWLVYTSIYFIERPDLPDSPEWRAASDIGRWKPLIRPRIKSRERRDGRVVAARLPDMRG